MFEKHQFDLHLYLKCHSSTVKIASENQLPGLSVNGTLVKNGLKEFVVEYLNYLH